VFGNMTTNRKTAASMNGHGALGENDVSTEEETAIFNDDGEELLWYFSYGSNMNTEIFEKKRKIKCHDHKVCKVPGYVLTFAEGMIPYVEPSFCTCLKRSDLSVVDDRPDIHGVAFLITKQQYEHMLLTEGGWGYQEYRNHPFWNIGHYGEEEIECVEIKPEGTGSNKKESDLKIFKALTLVGLFGVHQRYDCNASKRYYDLVKVGAESSGLPTSYREYLKEKHPAFEPISNCRWTNLAKWICIVIAFPCLFVEIGSNKLCIAWNERKLKQEKEAESSLSSSNLTKTATVVTRNTTRRRRQRFEDVIRAPWIIMKLSHVYRHYVLQCFMFTLIFDVLKFPSGFHNKTASTKKSQ